MVGWRLVIADRNAPFCKPIKLSSTHSLRCPRLSRLPISNTRTSTIWRPFNEALFREHFVSTWQCTATVSTKPAGGIGTLFISEPPPRQVGQFWMFPLLLNSISVTRSLLISIYFCLRRKHLSGSLVGVGLSILILPLCWTDSFIQYRILLISNHITSSSRLKYSGSVLIVNMMSQFSDTGSYIITYNILCNCTTNIHVMLCFTN